ncbi:hypothetical protein C8F04DRAFT_1114195 [Mycena alexandri]|uniref:Uncharacterized protein n=1 Tax=Mycena alexandri TaxID=1745969 RepID=A0AAD6SMJ1_9AGAR|nr:hypothetical protein C8F04DRAFT_1114195 [Mycena alexandri]
MSTYWDSYPNFVHNPTAPVQKEFKLLAAQCGWKVGGAQYKREWARCGREEFIRYFGSEEKGLDGWQGLCATVGIEEIPNSITQCKKVLRTVWVNIFDLVDAKSTGQPAKTHASADALRKYSMKKKKIFPKKAAKGNPFLKVLLIEMFL